MSLMWDITDNLPVVQTQCLRQGGGCILHWSPADLEVWNRGWNSDKLEILPKFSLESIQHFITEFDQTESQLRELPSTLLALFVKHEWSGATGGYVGLNLHENEPQIL